MPHGTNDKEMPRGVVAWYCQNVFCTTGATAIMADRWARNEMELRSHGLRALE